MDDKELYREVADFFLTNKAGQELRNRWEKRIQNLYRALAYEKDQDQMRVVQGAIQSFETIVLPEITNAVTQKTEEKPKPKEDA